MHKRERVREVQQKCVHVQVSVMATEYEIWKISQQHLWEQDSAQYRLKEN